MVNFSPKLEDAKNDQLRDWINNHQPNFGKLSSDELTRRTIVKLEETIKKFNVRTSKQTEKLIQLTWGIIGLTIVMVVGLIIQIILAI